MVKNKPDNMKLLKYLIAYTLIVSFPGLITTSGALAQWSPYGSSYGFPYVTAPPPDFSGYIWTSPTIGYNPITNGGISINYLPGTEWSSPYFQQTQTGYNSGYPFGGYNVPYNYYSLSGYPYSNMSGYGYWQPFSYTWSNPWPQPYQNYAWGSSYPFGGGYSWNPFTPQIPYNYNNSWINPWSSSSWSPVDDCSGDGILYRKPAIYLYPEEDTEVRVILDINGTFTKTIPSYGSGWEVLATREGTIFTTDLQNSFDYLFWEARMHDPALPDKGWVVAQEDLEYWLDEHLTTLGLNDKEEADFMEYWLDELSDSEYYEITLLDQSFLEANAKLTISPSPDTVIRVIFHFRPLDKDKIMEAPIIETPERKGFVVLEWGGILGE